MEQEYKKLLSEYIGFKSISTDSTYAPEMKKTAMWLRNLFEKNGFSAQLLPGEKMNDVVYATYGDDPKKETVLVYGHYDVQPADKADGWESDPFVLTELNNRLVCRGAIDNKGQALVHMATIFDLIKKNNLRYNIKFMLEGNEETGSPCMDAFIEKNRELLTATYVLISDGETAANKPTLEASLRGGFNIRVELQTGKTNLHSGLYGGAAPSAAKEAVKLINSFYDFKSRTVAIPGFYDGAKQPTDSERTANVAITTEAEILATGGFKVLQTEEGNDFFTQVGLRPTLEISGIHTGYTGEGFANIIPAKVDIRINGRTVAPQKTKVIMQRVVDHIKKTLPPYVTSTIHEDDHGDPVMVDITLPKAKEILGTLEDTYGEKPVIKYVGGSIPIVGMFQNMLHIPVFLVSLANDDCNMHGVHENFRIDLLKKALAFSRAFFEQK